MSKQHISPSQLGTYENCGEAYKRRYIEKDIIPPGCAAHRGRGIHRGAEMNFSQKIESKVDLKRDDIVDRAVAEFEASIKADGVLLSPDEEARGKGVVVGEEKDTVVSLAGLFSDEVAPVYQPTFVEEKIKIELPNSPRDLLGILDLTATIIKEPGRGEGIVDYKSGKKTKPQRDFDVSSQLSLYDLAYRAKRGKAPDFIQVEQLVDLKVPKRVTNMTVRSVGDFHATIARVNAMIQGLEAGIFMPASAGAWNCSPKWCGYWGTCPYVNSERKVVVQSVE